MSENQENLQPDAGVVLPDDSGENFTTGTGLPENAFRELGADEQYVPVMNPAHDQKEVTPYSVITGLVMAIIFSAAAAYLGLKVGQVFEAAIPIAIIAVGLSNMLGKKNAMGQNVIIQSIGACSGVIVAGAIFTLPALYILQGTYPDIMVHFYQIFLSSLLGGILGILFFIPFRRYFVKDMHGKYPFPEATATTQVLVSSEAAAAKGDNSQARTLILASLIGGIYDYIVATFGWWAETITSTASAWGTAIAEKTKLVFSCNTGAALLGLGYIVGLKYAFVIFAGSAFIWWVVVPLMGTYGSPEIASQAPEWIFSEYARKIGIGGIAMAGLIGIIKSWGIIVAAVGLAGKELKGNAGAVKNVRWQTDLSMKKIVYFIAIALVAVLLFFWFGVIHTFWQAAVAWLVVVVIAFLFTTVAANAIAIVGTNPVSGMTLMTLILASLVLVSVGLSGTTGMTAALVIGGVVCTALSMAGGFITDLKIGYWLGTTPKKQEAWKFLGTFVAAATVAGVMIILNKSYGFVGEGALVAPQANAMAAVIQPLMTGGQTPWMLYFCGAALALVLTSIGIPALAFALGMFIPMELNAPLVVGGLVAWFVSNRSKDEGLNKARFDRGTLIASGFIAGGALMGVVSAVLKFAGVDWFLSGWAASNAAEWVGLAMYLVLIGYMGWHTIKAKSEK